MNDKNYTETQLAEEYSSHYLMLREICVGRWCTGDKERGVEDCPLKWMCPHHFTLSGIEEAYTKLFGKQLEITETDIMSVMKESD